ncbi:uncharacterized protein LOC125676801 [Ostrea edulis]|uniref:uncharacterized protein LOC125676801 n=1 Tax=Ostrea edulis TaxID=37623 RepID=UPI0024AF2809|nr:uncharacterized protein LOC125676801 [Ostrea edulis]
MENLQKSDIENLPCEELEDTQTARKCSHQSDAPICMKCILSSKFQDSHLEILSDICDSLSGSKKDKIRRDLVDLEENIGPLYDSNLGEVEALLSTVIQKHKERKHVILDLGDELHKVVDLVINRYLSETGKMEKDDIEFVQSLKSKWKTSGSEIKATIKEYRGFLATENNKKLAKYQSRNAQFREMPSRYEVSVTGFQPHHLTEDRLYQMIGSPSPSVKTEIKAKVNGVSDPESASPSTGSDVINPKANKESSGPLKSKADRMSELNDLMDSISQTAKELNKVALEMSPKVTRKLAIPKEFCSKIPSNASPAGTSSNAVSRVKYPAESKPKSATNLNGIEECIPKASKQLSSHVTPSKETPTQINGNLDVESSSKVKSETTVSIQRSLQIDIDIPIQSKLKPSKQPNTETETKPKGSTELGSPDTKPKVTTELGSLDTKPKVTTELGSPDIKPKVSTELGSPDTKPKVSTELGSPDTKPKVTTELGSPDIKPKVSTELGSPDTKPKVSTELGSPDTKPKVNTELGSPDTKPKVITALGSPGEYSKVTTMLNVPLMFSSKATAELNKASDTKSGSNTPGELNDLTKASSSVIKDRKNEARSSSNITSELTSPVKPSLQITTDVRSITGSKGSMDSGPKPVTELSSSTESNSPPKSSSNPRTEFISTLESTTKTKTEDGDSKESKSPVEAKTISTSSESCSETSKGHSDEETSQFSDIPKVTDVYEAGYTYTYKISCAMSTNQIFVCGNTKVIKQMNSMGTFVEKADSESGNPPFDLALTRDAQLLYSDHNAKCINLVKSNGEIERVIQLEKWYPMAICSTSANDILVSMESDNLAMSKVVRYSGPTIKQEIQFDVKGEKLYCRADFIDENKNLDVVVSDLGARRIVVVDKYGIFRFNYTGNLQSKRFKNFGCTGVTTTSRQHVIVADEYNDVLHVIDSDGQFLMYIDSCKLQRPGSLCTDSEDMLYVTEPVANKVKKIKLYK